MKRFRPIFLSRKSIDIKTIRLFDFAICREGNSCNVPANYECLTRKYIIKPNWIRIRRHAKSREYFEYKSVRNTRKLSVASRYCRGFRGRFRSNIFSVTERNHSTRLWFARRFSFSRGKCFDKVVKKKKKILFNNISNTALNTIGSKL